MPAADRTHEFLPLVNAEREQHGLQSLRPSPALVAAARAGAEILAATGGDVRHPDMEGRLARAGYRWKDFKEVMAWGQDTPALVVAGWLASTVGHREALLSPTLTEAGFAMMADELGPWWMGEIALPVEVPPPPPPPPPIVHVGPPTVTGLVVGVGTYHEGTWTLVGANGQQRTEAFGIPGDVGFTGDWVGDGKLRMGVYRPSNSTFYLAVPGGVREVKVPPGGNIPVWGHW